MRKYDDAFKDDLGDAVEAIEGASGVELVVCLNPRLRQYYYIHFFTGAILALLVFTFLMFSPWHFTTLAIYLETLVAFGVGFGLPFLIPGIKRLFLGQQRKKLTELHARALFQKGQLTETEQRIGVLLFISFLEEEVAVIPDTGASEMIPPDELDDFKRQFYTIFNAKDPAEKLLQILGKQPDFFAKYIPRLPDDINELPDVIWQDS